MELRKVVKLRDRGEAGEFIKDGRVCGVALVKYGAEVLCPPFENVLLVLNEGGAICRSDWCDVSALGPKDVFDCVIEAVSVVGICERLNFFRFLDPPIIFHLP